MPTAGENYARRSPLLQSKWPRNCEDWAPLYMSKALSVLLVDPDRMVLSGLEDILHGVDVTTSHEFASARHAIADLSLDLLVTNLRLEAYNGVHLVHVARELRPKLPCIVYDRTHDVVLARIAQDAGAFYERYERLPAALISYVLLDLPSRDRRDPTRVDRRHDYRGGRRAADAVSQARA